MGGKEYMYLLVWDKGENMYIPGWNKWSPTCEICSRIKGTTCAQL